MRIKQYCVALVAAIVVAACGGGDDPAQVAPADVSKAFAAARRPQASPAGKAYQPQMQEVFSWAEETFPQWFPANGEPDHWVSMPDGDTITYRYYPITGNYLGVSNAHYIYVLGPITHYSLLYVGTTTDFGCQIFPFACMAPSVPVVAPQPVVWPEPARDPDVHAALQAGPFTVTRYLIEGQNDYSGLALQFYVDMTGYFESYPANTATLRIEDPHHLLGNTNSYELSGSKSIAVGTALKPPTAGLREGTWKVHVCLNADCSLEPANSPLEIPYRIEVTAATASTSVPSVNVDTPFGVVPSPVEVQVNLPPYATSWNATLVSNGNFGGGWAVASQRKWANNTGGAVTLKFSASTVGTHTATLKFLVFRRLPGNNTQTSQTLEVPVNYNVAVNPSVDYAFNKPEVVIVAQAGYTNIAAVPDGIYAVAASGVTIQSSGIDYLSGPSNLSLATSWLSLYNGASFHQCEFFGANPEPQCLPPGDYMARIRYTMSKGGVQSTVYQPVTLKLYP